MSLYFIFIEPMFMSIVFCILYYSVGSFKITKKNIALFWGATTILMIIMKYFKLSIIAIIFYLIILFIFEYKLTKKIYNTILKMIVIMILVTLMDMIAGYLTMLIFKISTEEIKELVGPNIILYLIGVIVTIFMTKTIAMLIKHKGLDLKSIKVNNLFLMYMSITALVTYLNATLLGTLIEVVSVQVVSLLIIIFAAHCILGIVFIYITKENTQKNMDLEMHTQENKRLIDYANLLEKQHDDLRVFKHDYMNMLATIGGYIQLRDLDKLDKYFKEKILNGGEIFKEDKNLELIKKIQSIPVRGMLYAKLVKAQEAKIDLSLNVTDSIPLFKMTELHVCKILGILIDNGIEATSLSKDKKIVITLCSELDNIKVSISNSFCGEIENINLLFNKGYSTNGEGRGLGLHTVRSLIDSHYKSTKLLTYINENLFTQEVLFLMRTNKI